MSSSSCAAAPDLAWLDRPDDQVREQLHALVAGVAARGGAVGWLHVPDRTETDAWLDAALDRGARLALARLAGRIVGCGYWVRQPAAVLRHNGEIRQVMTASEVRGRGVARAVVQALVADADRGGVELLTLDCRGNNHGALALYADLGFVVSGRRPDAIGVGELRFDQVLLHLDLRVGRPADAGLVRLGGRRVGPGSS